MGFAVCGCHLQLFEEQFDVPVVNKIKISNSDKCKTFVPSVKIPSRTTITKHEALPPPTHTKMVQVTCACVILRLQRGKLFVDLRD